MKRLWKPGDFIAGRWRVLKSAAKTGTTSRVYIVHDPQWNQPLALKVLDPEVPARDPAAADRFISEARIWIGIDPHPNVVQALMVRYVEGLPGIFLRYAPSNLAELVRAASLKPEHILVLAMQCCDGLNHVYSHGVRAHRDLKPPNCLIAVTGELQVTDFGLSIVAEHAKEGALQSRPAGTPAYMAPEVFAGLTADVRSDVYSFGTMLYELLSGHPPFATEVWEDLRKRHLEEEPPTAPLFDSIVRRCLEKDPEARFADFNEVRTALDREYEKLTGKSAPEPKKAPPLSSKGWTNKGANLSTLGEYEEALLCFDNALRANPGDFLAWYNRGNALLKMGQFENASSAYESARTYFSAFDTDPVQLAQILVNHGVALASLGKHIDAITKFDDALRAVHGFREALLGKAAALNGSEQFSAALETAEELLRDSPNNGKALYCKGRTLGGLQRWIEAGTALLAIPAGDKEHVQALFQAGQCFARADEYERALEAFSKLSQAIPDSLEVWERIAQVSEKLGRTSNALAALERVVELNPNRCDAWKQKARLQFQREEWSEVVKASEQVVKREAGDAGAWIGMAGALELQHDFGRALEAYKHGMRADPKSAKACLGAAYIERDHGDEKRAYKLFKRLTKLDPSIPEAWVNAGRLSGKLGQHKEALRMIEHSLKLRPEDHQAWASKALALIHLGRYEEALEATNSAIERNEFDANVWDLRGIALIRLDRYDDAIASYDRALELNPRLERARMNRDAAIEHRAMLGRLAKLPPGLHIVSPDELGGLASFLGWSKPGKHADRIKVCARDVEKNPADPFAWLNKGLAHKAAGESVAAEECFDEARRLGLELPKELHD
jgi:tetratricopeptide (TPR) repeat protein